MEPLPKLLRLTLQSVWNKGAIHMTILPDYIEPGLRVVFCGAAWGKKSLQTGKYYKDATNRFWEVLLEIGLIPRSLTAEEDYKLLRFGIGLLDLSKQRYSIASGRVLMTPNNDVRVLRRKIEDNAPLALAFNGKEAARQFYEAEQITYGRQPEIIGSTAVFVLPSTSGLASRWWDETYWLALRDFVEGKRPVLIQPHVQAVAVAPVMTW